MFSNIVKLAAESSLLNELMMDYLEGLINQLNDVGWQIDDKTLLVEDFAIEQRVITKIERKRDEKDEQRFSTGLEPTSKFYEIESDSERFETITWSNAVKEKNLRLGIKGSPGSGKTFSSRYTVIKIAHESLYKLQSHSAKLEDVEIPIWITAKELSNCSETKIADALIGILKQKLENLNLTDYFYDWLKRQMQAVFNPQESTSTNKNPFFVMVDALDELSGKTERNNFKRLVKKLDKPLVKLLATCRTLQWDGRRGLLGWKGLKSLELAPLKKYQKVEFLERFFSQNEKAKESAKTIFDNNYAVDYATDNSLILTFVCFLHLKGKIDENTTYIKIYANMQHELFIGSWKKEKAFWFEEGKTSRYSKRLDKIAFSIFSKKPDSNHFTLDAWDEAVEEIGLTEEESDKFREELVRIGFLVKAGVDELGDECWSFLHRTILEFTVGKAIFKRDDWFEIARKHYSDFAWLETLTFVAGLDDGKTKAKRMIDDLENEMQNGYLKNEVFGIGILLQTKFVGVSTLRGKDIEVICDRVIFGIVENRHLSEILETKLSCSTFASNFYGKFVKLSHSFLNLNKYCAKYFSEKLFQPVVINTIQNSQRHSLMVHSIAYFLKEFQVKSERFVKFILDDLQYPTDRKGHCYAESLGQLEDPSEEVTDISHA